MDDGDASTRLLDSSTILGDRPRLLPLLVLDDGEQMMPSARRMRRLAGVKRAEGLRERFVAGLSGLARADGEPSGARKYARGRGWRGRRLWSGMARCVVLRSRGARGRVPCSWLQANLRIAQHAVCHSEPVTKSRHAIKSRKIDADRQ